MCVVAVDCCCSVCGNQQCEFGEVCLDTSCSTGCRVDCPFSHLSCPVGAAGDGSSKECSGNGGICHFSSGVCECFATFDGDSCSECASGFSKSAGKCVAPAGAAVSCSDGIRNGSEEGVDCGGIHCPNACNSSQQSSSTSASMNNAQVVVVVVIVALVVGGVYLAGFSSACRRTTRSFSSREGR